MNTIIVNALGNASRLLHSFMADEANITEIEKIARQLAEVYERRGKLIVFGNGGSMCDAMHFAEELSGRFHHDRPALPAIAISDPGYLTCVANDYGYAKVFSRAVEAFANEGDMVVGISTSGNSENVINGLERAAGMNCFTCALLGKDGGKLKGKTDYQIVVPSDDTARIQEIHGMLIHIFIELVEKLLFSTDTQYLQDEPARC